MFNCSLELRSRGRMYKDVLDLKGGMYCLLSWIIFWTVFRNIFSGGVAISSFRVLWCMRLVFFYGRNKRICLSLV